MCQPSQNKYPCLIMCPLLFGSGLKEPWLLLKKRENYKKHLFNFGLVRIFLE